MIRKCKWCGKEFESNRRIYCSDQCRNDRYRVYERWKAHYDGRDWDNREEKFQEWLSESDDHKVYEKKRTDYKKGDHCV